MPVFLVDVWHSVSDPRDIDDVVTFRPTPEGDDWRRYVVEARARSRRVSSLARCPRARGWPVEGLADEWITWTPVRSTVLW